MVDPNMAAFYKHPPADKPGYWAAFIDGEKVGGGYNPGALLDMVEKIREDKVPMIARIVAKSEKVLML